MERKKQNSFLRIGNARCRGEVFVVIPPSKTYSQRKKMGTAI